MAEVADERMYEMDGGTVGIRLCRLEAVRYEDRAELSRALGLAPNASPLFHFDPQEATGWMDDFLLVHWRGPLAWTAIFVAQTGLGGLVDPVFRRESGWLMIAFGMRVHALDAADGRLVWRWTPEWEMPLHALAFDESTDTLFVALELGVTALRLPAGEGLRAERVWEYSHPDVIVGMRKAGGLLEMEQWDGLHFWIDAKTGERVESPPLRKDGQ